jgi:hypothetical protein
MVGGDLKLVMVNVMRYALKDSSPDDAVYVCISQDKEYRHSYVVSRWFHPRKGHICTYSGSSVCVILFQ